MEVYSKDHKIDYDWDLIETVTYLWRHTRFFWLSVSDILEELRAAAAEGIITVVAKPCKRCDASKDKPKIAPSNSYNEPYEEVFDDPRFNSNEIKKAWPRLWRATISYWIGCVGGHIKHPIE